MLGPKMPWTALEVLLFVLIDISLLKALLTNGLSTTNNKIHFRNSFKNVLLEEREDTSTDIDSDYHDTRATVNHEMLLNTDYDTENDYSNVHNPKYNPTFDTTGDYTVFDTSGTYDSVDAKHDYAVVPTTSNQTLADGSLSPTDAYNITYITDRIVADITDNFTILGLCNISQTGESKAHKRSLDFWLRNSTSANEAAIDLLDMYNLSDEFLSCPLITVEPECYQRLENGSVYVPLYGRVFDRGNYMISENLLRVCPDFVDTFVEKFSSNIDIISIAGALISMVFIILHVIMFVVVDKMRNLPGYCMFSMCLALLAVYICSFIQFQMSDHANCSAIGMIIYYSLLSSYFWMNVISYDVWQSIRLATAKFRLSSERPVLIRFSVYSLYAWGTPLLIVVISVISDLMSTDERYKLTFNEHTCWFRNKTALLIFFALPLFIVLFMNILFFISSFYMIQQSMFKSSIGSHNPRSNLQSRLFLTLKLGTAMGLMWIFGVIATITQREWLYYLYSIFNALQGVFIFFSFSVNKKTLNALKKVSKQSIVPRPIPKPSFCNTTVQTEHE